MVTRNKANYLNLHRFLQTLFGLCLSCNWFALASAQVSSKITFSDVWKLAQQNSLHSDKAKNFVTLANKELEAQAKSTDFKLSLLKSETVKLTLFESPKPKTSASLQQLIEDGFSLQASKILYDFGRFHATQRKLNLAIKLKEQDVETADSLLYWRCAKAYLSVLIAQVNHELAAEQLVNAETKKKFSFENFQKGLRPETDLTRAEVDLGKALLNMKRSRDALSESVLPLKLLMGAPVLTQDSKIWFHGSLKKNFQQWLALIQSWNELKVTPFEKSLQVQKDLTMAEIQSIEAQTRPTLSASAALVNSGTFPITKVSAFTQKWSAIGGLTFAWDIPWNGSDVLAQEAVLLKAKDVEFQEKIAKEERLQKAATTRLQIENVGSLIDLLKSQNTNLEKNLKLLRRKYEAGKASATELSNAEDELLSSRLELEKANSNVATLVLNLAELVGIDSVENVFL